MYNKGLEVYWSGKGPDGGRDLLCIEKYKSEFKSTNKRWLVQCKHNAHSGKAVGKNDLSGIRNDCDANKATGYILVCSTYPSSTVVNELEAIEKESNITTCFWDYATIERILMRPSNWSLINTFFPNSAKCMGIQVAQIEPDFWRIFYNGYVFYYSLRLGVNFNNYFEDAKKRIDELKNLKLPRGNSLRLRAIYFDDKHCYYRIYYDYLIPIETKTESFELTECVSEIFNERCEEGQLWIPDIMFYNVSIYGSSCILMGKS